MLGCDPVHLIAPPCLNAVFESNMLFAKITFIGKSPLNKVY